MSFDSDKAYVLNFFQNYILKYIITDLKRLNKIRQKKNGTGACTIPQAIATFSALDLLGYLVHPQDIKETRMSFSDVLNNQQFFPELKEYSSHPNFFNSFRDNIRSIMVHRFSLTKYDITKNKKKILFFERNGIQIFNVSYFTRIAIKAILKVHSDIQGDTFRINGCSRNESIEKLKDKINRLKSYEAESFLRLENIDTLTVTIETTHSI